MPRGQFTSVPVRWRFPTLDTFTHIPLAPAICHLEHELDDRSRRDTEPLLVGGNLERLRVSQVPPDA
jgi:hypothetical protein